MFIFSSRLWHVQPHLSDTAVNIVCKVCELHRSPKCEDIRLLESVTELSFKPFHNVFLFPVLTFSYT